MSDVKGAFIQLIKEVAKGDAWWYAINLPSTNPNSLAHLCGFCCDMEADVMFDSLGLKKNNQPVPLKCKMFFDNIDDSAIEYSVFRFKARGQQRRPQMHYVRLGVFENGFTFQPSGENETNAPPTKSEHILELQTNLHLAVKMTSKS